MDFIANYWTFDTWLIKICLHNSTIQLLRLGQINILLNSPRSVMFTLLFTIYEIIDDSKYLCTLEWLISSVKSIDYCNIYELISFETIR